MRTLSVNIDHIATLRQARRETTPDPVHAAVLAELGGADGITVHLRHDRRHINERDIRLLKAIIKTELNMELSAGPEMERIALSVKPAQVSLVPETPEEITTLGGLDLTRNSARISRTVVKLKKSGIRLSAFIEPNPAQVEAAARIGFDLIELNTDLYSREPRHRERHIRMLGDAAQLASRLGLKIHAGHGIDYLNIIPLLKIPELEGFSIGFAIVARAVLIGFTSAVSEMKRLMEVYS